ncbi:MAG: YjbQ family protein [Anaerolineales bacterium]|nr:YjbQ family protein [Anaerolineales bacterium]
MKWHKTSIAVQTRGKALYPLTDQVQQQIRTWAIQAGICYLFLQHTSASLVVSENWDPTAKADLETFMEKLVPERQAWFTHILEGDDDSTSHIRSMLTDVSLTIPIDGGRLSLGTWQGLYLFEHRARPHQRQVLVRCLEIEE